MTLFDNHETSFQETRLSTLSMELSEITRTPGSLDLGTNANMRVLDTGDFADLRYDTKWKVSTIEEESSLLVFCLMVILFGKTNESVDRKVNFCIS